MMIYDNLAYSYHQNQSPPSTFIRNIEEGSLNMGTSSLSSVACPVGTYHNTTIDVCQFCTKGSYQNQEGQLFCLMCRPGETSPDGATHLSQCMLMYSKCLLSKELLGKLYFGQKKSDNSIYHMAWLLISG